jgi:hypothetical protein
MSGLRETPADRRLALKVCLAVEEGDPVHVLAGVARERAVALLVTGTRGRNTLRSALRGSVTGGLVRAGRPVASVPVSDRDKPVRLTEPTARNAAVAPGGSPRCRFQAIAIARPAAGRP